MKLDYDTAWKEAVALLRRNAGLLAVIGGVFFFLPYAAVIIGLPELSSVEQGGAQGDPDQMMAALADLYSNYWWVFVGLALIQGTGLLAMLALVRRRPNPTVGEAIATGGKSVLSYIAAQILQSVAILTLALILVGVPASTGSVPLAVVGALIAIVLFFYIATKLSLIAPVIAIEGQLNPLAALVQSWRLTKGNSVRLFFFYLLLLVAFIVISTVITMVITLIFALGGEQATLFGTAITSALLNAGLIVVMTCVLASVHTQLVRLRDADAG